MRYKSYNRGKWAVQRERCHLPANATPPDEHAQASPLEDILPKVFKKAGLQDEYWERDLEERWPKIVGPQLAGRTRPGELKGTTLVVYVVSSTWLAELNRCGKAQMLKNLKAHLEKISVRDIRFQLDPNPGR